MAEQNCGASDTPAPLFTAQTAAALLSTDRFEAGSEGECVSRRRGSETLSGTRDVAHDEEAELCSGGAAAALEPAGKGVGIRSLC